MGVDCNNDACMEVKRPAREDRSCSNSPRKRMRRRSIAAPATAHRGEVPGDLLNGMNELCRSNRQPFRQDTSSERGSSKTDTFNFPRQLHVRPCFITHPQLHPGRAVPVQREGQASESQYMRAAATAVEGERTDGDVGSVRPNIILDGGSWSEEHQGDIMLSH